MRKFSLFRLRSAARRLLATILFLGVAPQRFAESRFIRELVSRGFVDSLYKNR